MPRVRTRDEPQLADPLNPLASIELSDDFELDDVAVEGASVEGTSGQGGRIRFSRLRDVSLSAKKLTGITISDVVAERIDLTAADLGQSHWRGVRITDCRCLGSNWAEASLVGVTFAGATLEMSNLRFAKLERVTFDRCDMTSVDFANAALANVVFRQCNLAEADFRDARLTDVDLRESQIEGVKGLASLRGARITVSQLLDIAPALAVEIGIDVDL